MHALSKMIQPTLVHLNLGLNWYWWEKKENFKFLLKVVSGRILLILAEINCYRFIDMTNVVVRKWPV